MQAGDHALDHLLADIGELPRQPADEPVDLLRQVLHLAQHLAEPLVGVLGLFVRALDGELALFEPILQDLGIALPPLGQQVDSLLRNLRVPQAGQPHEFLEAVGLQHQRVVVRVGGILQRVAGLVGGCPEDVGVFENVLAEPLYGRAAFLQPLVQEFRVRFPSVGGQVDILPQHLRRPLRCQIQERGEAVRLLHQRGVVRVGGVLHILGHVLHGLFHFRCVPREQGPGLLYG